MIDIAKLVVERQALRTQLDTAQEKFNELSKPYREEMEKLDAQITAAMTEQGIKSLKTDTGTAILSTIVTPKITDKEAFLNWVLDDWDVRGSMLQIATLLKDTITEYMDANEGHLPPNIEISSMLRFSIRKA